MVELGKYELVVKKALEQSGQGPWGPHDIDRAKSMLTHDFCITFDQECDGSAVHDWLSGLPDKEIEELLARLNA